ncbi:MAG: hypothetical protein Q8L26_08680 [Candidatus Omnitrophota bacterium]|nr:hypothetical protein [Candidatus Omnitrophota bacterium]
MSKAPSKAKESLTRKKRFKKRFIFLLSLAGLTIFTLLVTDLYNFVKNKSYLKVGEKYNNILKVLSDKTSILSIKPLAFVPYIPNPPQVEGQRKALIVALVKIKNKKLSKNIHVKFEIDDGAGRHVDSQAWDVIAKQRGLIFNMFYPETAIVKWSPDIPNGIEAIAKSRENPFKLWLTVTWQDINNKEHKIESYSELRYNEKQVVYYFDERENKWLF